MTLRMDWSRAAVILMFAAMQLSLCSAAENEDFADFKIDKLGETARLYCNSTDSNQARDIPYMYEPIAWMLPNLSRVDSVSGKFRLEEQNWTLIVENTTIEDVGVYHCMLLNSSQHGNYYLVKVGLNAEGPYFFDMWEKYMWPTIIGLCAFFGFLLLTAIAVLIYHFRYISFKEEDERNDSESEREAEIKAEIKAEGDSVKAVALTDDGIRDSLPPYNGKGQHVYENPSFHEEVHTHEDKKSEESDDEDLTNL